MAEKTPATYHRVGAVRAPTSHDQRYQHIGKHRVEKQGAGGQISNDQIRRQRKYGSTEHRHHQQQHWCGLEKQPVGLARQDGLAAQVRQARKQRGDRSQAAGREPGLNHSQ